MFFFASKILVFALKPLNWAFALAAWAYFRRSRRALLSALLVLLVFTNQWLVNAVLKNWESGFSPTNVRSEIPFDAAIVLGGYLAVDAGPAESGNFTFHRSASRLVTALQLYQTGRVRHILLSGGDGRLLGPLEPESRAARRLLLDCGVPDSVIWVEDQSRNTLENARFSRQLLDSLGYPQARCLLISSAWHLPRARRCFEAAGLPCTPLGTDYLSVRAGWTEMLWPTWEALMRWELLLKEWVGYAVYDLKDWK